MMIDRRQDIDAIIEQALRTERMRPTPMNLHRGVEQRVRIAQLRDHEALRFRYSMATLGVAFLAALLVAGLLVSFTNLSVLINHGVSGGRGQYDAFTTSMQISYSGYSGAYSLISSMLLASGTILVALIPIGWQFRSHQTPKY